MSEEQRRRLREARRHFESLRDENPGDSFSGADHDRVLYGEGRWFSFASSASR